MTNLALFLISAFIISFSGAAAPGPVTAASIAMGVRNKYAGALLVVGHAIIELPLILLIILGFSRYFQSSPSQIIIGLAGGAFLLWMALGLFANIKKSIDPAGAFYKTGPIMTGVILSATNPYFTLWWITIGIKLATKGLEFSIAGFILFVLAHWSSDLIWFQFLSFAAFKGGKIMSGRNLKIVFGICATAMMCYGIYFIYGAVRLWVG